MAVNYNHIEERSSQLVNSFTFNYNHIDNLWITQTEASKVNWNQAVTGTHLNPRCLKSGQVYKINAKMVSRNKTKLIDPQNSPIQPKTGVHPPPTQPKKVNSSLLIPIKVPKKSVTKLFLPQKVYQKFLTPKKDLGGLPNKSDGMIVVPFRG